VIGLPRAVRVWVHREPVDMKKSFDTLAAVARLQMRGDVMSGEIFVFVGRRRRHAKLLWWDGTGMVVLAKRLVRSRFAAPWERGGDGSLRWTLSELSLFLEGSEFVMRMRLSPPAWHPDNAPVHFT
jgi:transposase